MLANLDKQQKRYDLILEGRWDDLDKLMEEEGDAGMGLSNTPLPIEEEKKEPTFKEKKI